MDKNMPCCRCHLALSVALISLIASLPTFAADLYRWQDEKGNVYYTDRVPPKYVEQGYRVISEQGFTIQTIKSVADLEAEEGNKPPPISKEQAMKDQRLLMTYANEDEIIAARERKLADVQALIDLSEETISLLELQFRQLTKEASDFEKQGKTIPESLLTQIASTRKKLGKYQTKLDEHKQSLEQIKLDYNNDLLRYRQLKSIVEKTE